MGMKRFMWRVPVEAVEVVIWISGRGELGRDAGEESAGGEEEVEGAGEGARKELGGEWRGDSDMVGKDGGCSPSGVAGLGGGSTSCSDVDEIAGEPGYTMFRSWSSRSTGMGGMLGGGRSSEGSCLAEARVSSLVVAGLLLGSAT